MPADQPLTGWRRRLSQFKSIAWTAFAMCAIGLAVLVGLGSLLLPYAGRWTPQITGWLEQQLGQPVQIQQLSARWEGNGPRLRLSGVTVGSGRETLYIDDAEVAVDTLAFVRPGAGLAHFRVLVEEVVVNRDLNGNWGLKGLPGGDGPLPALGLLQGMGLRAGRLSFRDEATGHQLDLGELDLDLRNRAKLTRLAGQLSQADRGAVQFVLEQGRAGSRVYLSIRDLDLVHWQQQLPVAGLVATGGFLDGELWGSFSAGQIDDLQWQGSLDGLRLRPLTQASGTDDLGPQADAGAAGDSALAQPQQMPAAPILLSLRDAIARFSRVDGGWVAQLLEGELETASGIWDSSALSVSAGGQQLNFSADWLPLADLAGLLPMLQQVPEPVKAMVSGSELRGLAQDLRLSMERVDGDLAINGAVAISALGWEAAGARPGINNLNVALEFDHQKVTVRPAAASAVTLTMPQVFRWPLVLTELDGPLTVSWAGNPLLQIPALSLRTDGVQGILRLTAEANGNRPFVDLQLHVSEGQVAEAKRFWPRNKFSENLLSWLDSGLLAGTVTGGTALLYGDLDDWPFRSGEGRFEARAVVEGGRLDYDSSWPIAEDIDATIGFNNSGITATIKRATLDLLSISDSDFQLPKYRDPRIILDLNGRAEGQDFLTFLSHTPLHDSYQKYLEGLKIAGPARATAHVELPLKVGQPDRSVDGVFHLDGAQVSDSKWQVSFTETRGDVRFTHEGLRAENLSTRWESFPSTLSLATGSFVKNPLAAAEAQLTGVAPASVFSAELPQLAPLLKRIPAACEWVASLMIGLDGEMMSDGPRPRLTVQSSLIGSEVQLPAPLSKFSGQALPMTVGMDLPEFGNLSLDVAELLKFRFRPAEDGQPWGGTLHLGPGEPKDNANPGLLIEGEMDFLDLDEWQEVLTDFTASELPDDHQRWLTAMDLRINRVRFAYREFSNLHLRTSRNNNYWTLHINADQMEGKLRVPLDPDGRRLLLAEMERLEWPASSQTLGSPTIDPASIPPLRFVAGNVSFDGVPYGSVSFESYPVRNGMHIDQLETQSDTMAISANGEWLLEDGEAQSQFKLTIIGDELGAIFEAFGFSRLIEGGQTIVGLDVNWPGGLSEFEMASLNGEMDVSISNGQIVEVDPGAGRLFGLMSLHSLPRRLTLDFSDLFKTGLTFDTIEGNFQLDQGSAYTDDLQIKGPTADIEIKGTTSIGSQDYDQIVTVIPEVGATLPIVGALAGGAGGAAAAFLLQNLFGRQIDKISQFHYSVTGSFQDPQVELIGADDQRLELETARALRREAESAAKAQEDADESAP